MSEDKTYNGWTNYETWAVHLWLTNEESSYTYWCDAAAIARGRAKECSQVKDRIWTADQAARYTLADRLKDELEDASQDMLERGKATASIWADLLNAALSEVSWSEVAAAFLEE